MPEIIDGYDNPVNDYAGDPLVSYDPGSFAGSGATGGLNDWGSWARNIAGTVVQGAVDTYKYRTIGGAGGVPAISPTGQVYTEGRQVAKPATVSVGGMSVPTMAILAGAVGLVAILLLRK